MQQISPLGTLTTELLLLAGASPQAPGRPRQVRELAVEAGNEGVLVLLDSWLDARQGEGASSRVGFAVAFQHVPSAETVSMQLRRRNRCSKWMTVKLSLGWMKLLLKRQRHSDSTRRTSRRGKLRKLRWRRFPHETTRQSKRNKPNTKSSYPRHQPQTSVNQNRLRDTTPVRSACRRPSPTRNHFLTNEVLQRQKSNVMEPLRLRSCPPPPLPPPPRALRKVFDSIKSL